ncbi:MAG: TRAP transporter large permease [Burkholderiales bacterium]|nr:TRAP transporter large permease [Burkholderiales bacterium]
MITGIIAFAVLLALCFVGLPLAFAMIVVGVAGLTIERGFGPAAVALSQQAIDWSTNYGLTVLPMFILMGALVHHARLAEDLYAAANAWMGHRRGGLAMATISASAGLAAVSGTSLATTAIMSKVSIPAMRRYRYSDSLAAGSCAAGGTLGILIPPSIPMAIYGIITETDIGLLFIAGILPGILLTLLYVVAVAAIARLDPAGAPPAEISDWPTRWRLLVRTWGIVALMLLVLGGMYFGIFTPTEAAGIGAAGALFYAMLRKQLSLAALRDSLLEAGKTTSNVFMIGIGALVFAKFLTLAGMTGAMVKWVEGLDVSPLGVVWAICLIYIVLGCVFESLGMLLLTVPIFFPVVQALGIDPIWFGIIVILVVEIGLITPPVGINVFIVKGLFREINLWTIYRGIVPFLIANILCLVIIMYVPSIATWLPKLMR